MANLIPEPSHAPAVAAAVLLVGIHLGIVVVDLISWYTHGRVASVSSVIQQWSIETPILPLVIGLVLGHLFWPTRHPR